MNSLSFQDKSVRVKKGLWSNEEKIKFKEAIFIHGKDFKLIKNEIPTRSLEQCNSHFQKYFNRVRNKFMKEMQKNKSNLVNIISYLKNWINEYIRIEFVENMQMPVSHYNILRLQEIFLNSISGKKKQKKKIEKKCCNCIECDCEGNCCRNDSIIDSEMLSGYKIKKIFNIQKFNRNLRKNWDNSEDFNNSIFKLEFDKDLINDSSVPINIDYSKFDYMDNIHFTVTSLKSSEIGLNTHNLSLIEIEKKNIVYNNRNFENSEYFNEDINTDFNENNNKNLFFF